MPAWNDLVRQVEELPNNEAKAVWLSEQLPQALIEIGRLRSDRNVLLYGSAFLQRPVGPVSMSPEDLNGFMACVYGMDCSKGLTLLVHSPGGSVNAAETIVSYLRSKFIAFEVIVPAFAMSAGTMIALASEQVVMGRQSQLGPIDPQLPIGGRTVSAGAVVDQFERARREIAENPDVAHLWAPVLASIGPSLLQDAQNSLEFGEAMVTDWLDSGMFADLTGEDSATASTSVAKYFNNASMHKNHGRRIDSTQAAAVGVRVEQLEDSQALQEAVLNAYHLMTIAFEITPAARMIQSSVGQSWLRNVAGS